MRTNQLLPNEMTDDLLSSYWNKYGTNSSTNTETPSNKRTFTKILQGAAVLLGLTAGLPWLNAAFASSGSSLILGWLTVSCMMIGYGSLTAWLFLELINKLGTEPPEAKKIRSAHSIVSPTARHITCHTLGLVTTIPSIFMSYQYNTQLLYIPLAAFISYTSLTIGFYTIGDTVLGFVKKRNSPNQDIVKMQEKFIAHLLEPTNTKKIDENRESPYAKLKIALIKGAAISVALINATSYSLFPFNALNPVISSLAITLPIVIFIALPLAGSEYFGIDHVFDSLQRIKGWLSSHEEKALTPSSIVHKKYPVMFFTSLTASFIVSILSARTDSYIVSEEANNSALKNMSLLLTLTMWSSKTIVETYSMTTLIHKLLALNSRRSDKNLDEQWEQRERIVKFAELVSDSDPQVFSDYLSNNSEINKLLNNENLPSLSSPSIDEHSNFLFNKTGENESSLDEGINIKLESSTPI